MKASLAYEWEKDDLKTIQERNYGKTIKDAYIHQATDKHDDVEGIVLVFEDDTTLKIMDAGQSCCEHRYMTTDDDPKSLIGAKLSKIEVKDGPEPIDTNYTVHETQFLEITTDKGFITCVTHNEHNGYYGGLNIALEDSMN